MYELLEPKRKRESCDELQHSVIPVNDIGYNDFRDSEEFNLNAESSGFEMIAKFLRRLLTDETLLDYSHGTLNSIIVKKGIYGYLLNT